MIQNARQKAELPVDRDFHKLMDNANFGIDCRNNIDNCKFEPIYDEIGKISFIENMKIYLAAKNIKILLASKQCVMKSSKHLMKNSSPYIRTTRINVGEKIFDKY